MSNLKNVLASFNKARNDVIVELKKNVSLGWLHLEDAVKERTPVSSDWWALQSSINTTEPKEVWTKIVVEVWTNLEYAGYVEYWVTAKTKLWKERKNPFDYHKWDRVFYTGTGAGMFRKSVEAEQETISDIIKKWW